MDVEACHSPLAARATHLGIANVPGRKPRLRLNAQQTGNSRLGRLLLAGACLGAAIGSMCWPLPATAAVVTLSCDGTMNAEKEQAKPQAISKMGLTVNFDAGIVTGLTAITARIDQDNGNSVSFKGSTTHPTGAKWSVHGTIDRTTGGLGAAVTWFNSKTNELVLTMNYDLICTPASSNAVLKMQADNLPF
jgi:hypothetical protein